MIDTDVTRALALIAVVVLVAMWMSSRKEHRRAERRSRLQDTARNFGDALADFMEDVE